MDSITSTLEGDDENYSGEGARCTVIHMYPGDVPTIAAGMRTIISGFVNKGQTEENGALYSTSRGILGGLTSHSQTKTDHLSRQL